MSVTGTAGGAVAGVGGSVGISVSGTNASSVDQLLGPFVQGSRGLGPTATITGVSGGGVQGGGIIIGVGAIGGSPQGGAQVTTTSAIIQVDKGVISVGNSGSDSIWSSPNCK